MDASHWNFFISQKRNNVHIKKNHQRNVLVWKYYENWLNICKIQKSVRNIPRNNVIKDNINFFLKIVSKALSAYAKKPRMAIMFDILFHDLLSCSE